jgi:ribosome biogenesis protein Tsr3
MQTLNVTSRQAQEMLPYIVYNSIASDDSKATRRLMLQHFGEKRALEHDNTVTEVLLKPVGNPRSRHHRD